MEEYGFIVAGIGFQSKYSFSLDPKTVVIRPMPRGLQSFAEKKGQKWEEGENSLFPHREVSIVRQPDMFIGDLLVLHEDDVDRLTEIDQPVRLDRYENLGCALSVDDKIQVEPRSRKRLGTDYFLNVHQSRSWLPNSVAFEYILGGVKVHGLVNLLSTNSRKVRDGEDALEFCVSKATRDEKKGVNLVSAKPVDRKYAVDRSVLYVAGIHNLDLLDGELLYGNSRPLSLDRIHRMFPGLAKYNGNGFHGIDRLLIGVEESYRDSRLFFSKIQGNQTMPIDQESDDAFFLKKQISVGEPNRPGYPTVLLVKSNTVTPNDDYACQQISRILNLNPPYYGVVPLARARQ